MESYLSTLNPQDRLSLLSLLEPQDDASDASTNSKCEAAEDLQEENKRLKRQLAYYKQQWNEVKDQKERLETALESLRGLVSHYMGSESKLLQKSIAEKQFWSKVEVDNLLDKSEPPPDFPFREELPMTSSTIQKLSGDLAAALKELNALHFKHDKLQASYETLSASYTQFKVDSEKQQETDNKKLKGVIRRVQYLVGEKSKLEEETKRQSAYITKLELRLVHDEAKLKEVKNIKKPLSSRLMESLPFAYKFD
mmetsp:Transcript_34720/g.61086  ORF Transcript_34720/g.61086 Transcript_34720/m.61086 type:complete len:253 (+) Transcript_34720:424-1182(+)